MKVLEVVKILKGGTSNIIRSEFPELEEFLWGDSLWADGYFAETVGKVDEESHSEIYQGSTTVKVMAGYARGLKPRVLTRVSGF